MSRLQQRLYLGLQDIALLCRLTIKAKNHD
jgi:hypothetical protein